MKHPNLEKITTYRRWNNQIDYTFVSSDIVPYVTNCEFTLFNEFIRSDHWMFFVDIDDCILKQNKMRIDSLMLRGHCSNDNRGVEKYITTLHCMTTDHNIFNRSDLLNKMTEPNHSFVEDLDKQIGALMLVAENSCKRRYKTPYSL